MTYNPFREKVILIIALAGLVLALVQTVRLEQTRVHYAELNRLQGVFNDKTIEFFKLINENQYDR